MCRFLFTSCCCGCACIPPPHFFFGVGVIAKPRHVPASTTIGSFFVNFARYGTCVCWCMRVCVHVFVACLCVYVRVRTRARFCANFYEFMRAHLSVCFACVCLRAFLRTCLCLFASVRLCVPVFVCAPRRPRVPLRAFY
uniref:Putative syntaxin-binding protein 2 n=1 Tax=Rhipicephalus pulchellus TaxID=72859 RepID=L7LVQ3_RHIPC